jgi:hypothetical protein
VAAALFLVLALYLDALADGLTVRHARLMKFQIHTEFALQFFLEHLEVDLTDAAQNGLMRLRILLDENRRVLILLLGQCSKDFILIALFVGRRGHREHRRRIFDILIDNRVGPIAERIARLDGLQLRRCDDIAGRSRGQMLLPLALQ